MNVRKHCILLIFHIISAVIVFVPRVLIHHDAEEDQEGVSEDLGASTSSEVKAADDTQIDTFSLDASTEVHATTGDTDLDTVAVFLYKVIEGEEGVIPGEM